MGKPKRGAPKKPPELRKEAPLQVRLTAAERIDCETAAAKAGIKLSAWARQTLAGAAKRQISRA
jgi:hypothetical protein